MLVPPTSMMMYMAKNTDRKFLLRLGNLTYAKGVQGSQQGVISVINCP